jgi:hypothetical protein
VASEKDITPTEQQQPITGVATLETLGIALCTVGSGFVAGAEVHRGRNQLEQELFLRRAAIRCRDLRKFLTEAEQLLIAIAGYGSDRSVAVVSQPKEGVAKVTRLKIACLAVGAACLAAAGVAKFAAGYPNAAIVLAMLGSALPALAATLPAPKETP